MWVLAGSGNGEAVWGRKRRSFVVELAESADGGGFGWFEPSGSADFGKIEWFEPVGSADFGKIEWFEPSGSADGGGWEWFGEFRASLWMKMGGPFGVRSHLMRLHGRKRS